MEKNTKTTVDARLVDAVVIPKNASGIPVIGEYLSSLAQRFVQVDEAEILMLSNCFAQNDNGKLVLKLHNPFVETAIFNVISDELKRLVTAAAKERKDRDAKAEAEKKTCSK